MNENLASLGVSDGGPAGLRLLTARVVLQILQQCGVCPIVMGQLEDCRGGEQKQRPLS